MSRERDARKGGKMRRARKKFVSSVLIKLNL